MSDHIHEFLASKNDFESKEDVFDYCDDFFDYCKKQELNQINEQEIYKLKCYWKSKFLFITKDETLELRKRKELSDRLREYIKSFYEVDWENKDNEKFFSKDYLKRNIVERSIPYTLAIFTNIILKQPYFSRDDEEYYYFIDNPILKDKATKTPMARGSGIKGKLEVCAAEVIYESINKDKNNLISELIKYLRIFGSGNDEIKTLNELLKKLFNEKKIDNLADEIKEKIATQFISFILLNFGGKVAKKTVDNILSSNSYENIINEIIDWIYQNSKDKKEFKIQKGRLTFYPMYFNKINIEVINRHSREKRVGQAPIYFEVVPKGEDANLILVYTPFDIIFSKNKEEMRKEAEEDLDFIIKCLEKLQEEGIGAKRKYGWGQFEMKEKTIIKRNQDELNEYEGWEIK